MSYDTKRRLIGQGMATAAAPIIIPAVAAAVPANIPPVTARGSATNCTTTIAAATKLTATTISTTSSSATSITGVSAASAKGTPAAGLQIKADPDKPNDGSEVMLKPQQKKRSLAFQLKKKLRKRKQNARLRKLLQPKNAMMVLRELKAGINFTFQEHTNALTQTMFVVSAEVDGKVYVGGGLSKSIAKQNAAEKALKDLLLERMSDAAVKTQKWHNAEVVEPMQQEVNNAAGSGVSDDGSIAESAQALGKPPVPEDDVPWGNVASFALYKLFTEWQSQGTHVPLPFCKQKPVLPPPARPLVLAAHSPMKKIPENPTGCHPVLLLHHLKPGIQFTEARQEHTHLDERFTMSVTVDGKTYSGVGKTKKEAKKAAAIACLAGSFKICY
ncbi:double-stranded RNA-specific editase 1-like [Schistocerca serialis cubense]|uniref:double-stranded RNA-specific editase 1-like n=1 Tax=Schistocerca serialis cubense TaxID=2023355 RepID=UPI00214E55B4|nr:double-stranded RNA-specific editase 1-like [Schistocerca serialis cubense]